MKEFNELVSPTLTSLFVKEITKSILSGKLAIGEKLPNERELARMMKVSRAVIKGGIAQLASKGFIEVIPRVGAFVADYKRQGNTDILQSLFEHNNGKIDQSLLDSIYEVRENQERHIIQLAAKHRTEKDLAAMYHKIEFLEELGDPQELGEETFNFYHLLAIASGNLVYPLLFFGNRRIYISLFQATYRHIQKSERLYKMKLLVEFIEAKNPEEAANCGIDIIRWAKNVMYKHATNR